VDEDQVVPCGRAVGGWTPNLPGASSLFWDDWDDAGVTLVQWAAPLPLAKGPVGTVELASAVHQRFE
jgi:hypothetical protein